MNVKSYNSTSFSTSVLASIFVSTSKEHDACYTLFITHEWKYSYFGLKWRIYFQLCKNNWAGIANK